MSEELFREFLEKERNFIEDDKSNEENQRKDREGLEKIRREFPREDLDEIDENGLYELMKNAVGHWEAVTNERQSRYTNHLGRAAAKIRSNRFAVIRGLIERLDAWDHREPETKFPFRIGIWVPFLRVYYPDLFLPHTDRLVEATLRVFGLRLGSEQDIRNHDLVKYLRQYDMLARIPTVRLAHVADRFMNYPRSRTPPASVVLGVQPANGPTDSPILGPPEIHQWATDPEFRRRHPNLILYGPPGTGKTYIAGQVAKRFQHDARMSRPLASSPEDQAFEQVREKGLRWIDVVALALYDEERRETRNLSAKEIRNNRWVEAKAKERGRTGHVLETIWATLQAHAEKPATYSHRLEPYIFIKDAQRRWSLSDEGKEFALDLVGRLCEEEEPGEVSTVTAITFHPSYSYEDFIEGLRPVTEDEEEERGQLRYEVRKGAFRQACETARAYPDRDFLVVIDEINRGNIAKVFGELITLIEKDKRFEFDRKTWKNDKLEPVRLPISGDAFFVPENLFILGTMNTADRSIALIDLALRRRFAFIELMPDGDILRKALPDQGRLDGLDIPALLVKLNNGVMEILDRDHAIGHSYFLDERLRDERLSVDERKEAFWEVWTFQITPLLEEYFYGKDYRLKDVFPDGSGLIEAGAGSREAEHAQIHLKRFPGEEADDLLKALTRWTSQTGPETD